jgi:protein-disulfide isomerase
VAAQSGPTYVEEWKDALAVGIRSGSADARVQIVEFADFQCPFCANFEPTMRAVRDKYPDQVAFTFVPLPLPYHPFAAPAARAAECAHKQGSFDGIRSILFQQQQAFGSTSWTDFAKQGGVADLDQFDACVKETQPIERVEEGEKLATRFHVQATPTIYANGWKLPLPLSPQDFDKIVKNVSAGKAPIS